MTNFEKLVNKTEYCWIWLGGKTKSGYGTYRKTSAHKFSYRLHKGEVPDNLELDHLCNNRSCVNPKHLEPVTHSENQRRAWARGSFANRIIKKKTHCKQGHIFNKENTYIQNGFKTCRICHKIREYNRRHKI